MPEGVLTIQEAAEFLKLSPSTIRKRKDIPRRFVPGTNRQRFIPHELVEWLNTEQAKPVKSGTTRKKNNGWYTFSEEQR